MLPASSHYLKLAGWLTEWPKGSWTNNKSTGQVMDNKDYTRVRSITVKERIKEYIEAGWSYDDACDYIQANDDERERFRKDLEGWGKHG